MRDQILTFFITGQQPAALTLTWLWYLLAQHADAQERLADEVDTLLGGREPTLGDLPQLRYTKAVVEETLRLYPPVYIFFHQVFRDDVLGGYPVPAKALVSCLTYATQRDPAFWDAPDAFRPERFLTARPADQPAFAYYPFGGGPRQCIGRHVGLLEVQLATAIIAQRYRLQLAPGASVRPQPVVLLRTAGPVPLTLMRRAPMGSGTGSPAPGHGGSAR